VPSVGGIDSYLFVEEQRERDMTMGEQLSEELIPDDLREIYRKVYTSVDQVEDERVKIALISILKAVHADTTAANVRCATRSNVVPFLPAQASQE